MTARIYNLEPKVESKARQVTYFEGRKFASQDDGQINSKNISFQFIKSCAMQALKMNDKAEIKNYLVQIAAECDNGVRA